MEGVEVKMKPITKDQINELILLITYDREYDAYDKRRVIAKIHMDWEMCKLGPVEYRIGMSYLGETRAFEVARMANNDTAKEIDWETALRLVGLK